MTDGVPNGDEAELKYVICRTIDMVTRNKLTAFPIGIDNESDMSTLNSFSSMHSVLKLWAMKFRELFACIA